MHDARYENTHLHDGRHARARKTRFQKPYVPCPITGISKLKRWPTLEIPYEKKVLVSIPSNTFSAIKYWKFAKKVLDLIITDTFFHTGCNTSAPNR